MPAPKIFKKIDFQKDTQALNCGFVNTKESPEFRNTSRLQGPQLGRDSENNKNNMNASPRLGKTHFPSHLP